MASDPPTQLYVVAAVPSDSGRIAALAGALARVLDARPGLVSAVLLEPEPGATLDARAAPLVDLVQKRSAAAILSNDAQLARTLRADGVHIGAASDPMPAYEDARDILGTRFIVGAEATQSRHDAMSLGEAGAEYVAFGLGGHATAAAQAQRLALVAWWSEIFEVPCVALDIDDASDTAELAEAGADFLAVRLPAGLAPDDAARWVEGHAAALAGAAAVRATTG